ncbi:energy transducer TonB [Dyadobacter crusticola]|uniref:energy transducer TonB n=1 Tax=Dyadobacter crusticola TaxID=292407 RepID=UPI0004E19306|nr:energy transducer TonB [Dyadobacter crusticola]
MAEFDQRSPINLKDFERYQSGTMSFEEQHAFEKRLLSNPAFAEAYEGFLLLSPTAAEAEMISNALADKLAERLARNKSREAYLWSYASAAAILITAGVFWIVFSQTRTVEEVGQTPTLIEQPIVKAKETAPEQKSAPVAPAPLLPKKQKSARPLPVNAAAEPELNIAAAPPVMQDILADSLPVGARVAVAEPVPSAFVAPPSSIQLFKKSAPAKVSRSSSRLVSDGVLNEQFDAQSDGKPQPQAGWQDYLSYIRQNTPHHEGNETVIVSFMVKSDGTLTDIKATGKLSLQQSAIDIVRNGPPWTPAKQNGISLDAPAQVAIYFHSAK